MDEDRHGVSNFTLGDLEGQSYSLKVTQILKPFLS